MESLNVIILAGGKSSRMGEDKGLMSLFGKPMIGYVIDTVHELTDHITIVSNNDQYNQFGLDVIKDEIPDKGPLGGIYTGLQHSKFDQNIILSCDIPYIKIGLLKYLLQQSKGYDITIPIHKEQIHPLIGIYQKSCLNNIKKNLISGNLKVTDSFSGLKLNIVETDEFDEIAFKNLNSKQDINPSI